jgi:hypothetical protein
MRNSKTEINIEELKRAIKKCRSFREVSKYFNSDKDRRYYTNIIKKLNLDFSHFSSGDHSCYIGKTYNNLTIRKIYRDSSQKIKRIMCECDCACGNKKITRLEAVLSKRVISCGCAYKNRKSMLGNKNPAFTGVGDIGSRYFNDVLKVSAKKRKIPFNLTKEYLWDLFIKQDKKCAYTKIPLHFGRAGYTLETTASLDRIDNSKGYEEGNVQWVLKDINRMKWVFDSKYFVELCTLVAETKGFDNGKDSLFNRRCLRPHKFTNNNNALLQ